MKLADPSLHLALLDEIQPAYTWVGAMRDAYEVARTDHPEWLSWAAMHEDEDAPKPSLEAFLLTSDVPDEALAGVTRLTLDNDREVYEYLHPSWWQDGDHFVIRDLSGLECCTALTYLHLGQGVTEGCSLRPLASLTGLTELWVCASSHHTDVKALLGLPQLRKLELANCQHDDERALWKPVVDAVAARSQA